MDNANKPDSIAVENEVPVHQCVAVSMICTAKNPTTFEEVSNPNKDMELQEENNNTLKEIIVGEDESVVVSVMDDIKTSSKNNVLATETQKNLGTKPGSTHKKSSPKQLFEYKKAFHWICFDRKYKMSPSFESKTFCAEFTSKILVFKAIQFLAVASWTLVAQSSDTLVNITENYFWTFFIALFAFTAIYFSARLTDIIKSIPQATCGYVLSTISLSHICASVFIHWATYTVPIILLTLVFSYIVVCIFCLGFTEVDVKRQDIFVPIVLSTIIYSLISYAAIMLVHDPSRMVYQFGEIWIPSMMISLLVATGEMQEVQKLLHGLRLPLKDNEWIIATNYVL